MHHDGGPRSVPELPVTVNCFEGYFGRLILRRPDSSQPMYLNDHVLTLSSEIRWALCKSTVHCLDSSDQVFLRNFSHVSSIRTIWCKHWHCKWQHQNQNRPKMKAAISSHVEENDVSHIKHCSHTVTQEEVRPQNPRIRSQALT